MTKSRLIGLMLVALLLLAVAPVAAAHRMVERQGADGCPAGPRPETPLVQPR